MNATFHKNLVRIIACLVVCSFSACTVDTNNLPEQVHLIEATASSTPASSATSSRSNQAAHHNNQGLSGFVQVWSSTDSSTKIADEGQQISTQTKIAAIYASQEYAQLRVIMNTNNYERAKQVASTQALKTLVEQEYRMHLEMLSTEQITAKADQVSGAREL